MNKKYLTLAFLITGFLLAGDAYGEDEDGVYYCSEIAKNGFDYDKKRDSWEPIKFKLLRFKMKLDRVPDRIEIIEGDRRLKLVCKSISISDEMLNCNSEKVPIQFMFNISNGRFVYSNYFGYILKLSDSVFTSHGKCDKF